MMCAIILCPQVVEVSIVSNEAKWSISQMFLATAVILAGLPTCRSRRVCWGAIVVYSLNGGGK